MGELEDREREVEKQRERAELAEAKLELIRISISAIVASFPPSLDEAQELFHSMRHREAAEAREALGHLGSSGYIKIFPMELNENQEELLEEICEKSGVTRDDLAEKFCIPRALIDPDLLAMEDAGLIRLAHRGEFVPMLWVPTVAGTQARRALAK